jgi:hypothetical protein
MYLIIGLASMIIFSVVFWIATLPEFFEKDSMIIDGTFYLDNLFRLLCGAACGVVVGGIIDIMVLICRNFHRIFLIVIVGLFY